MTAGDGRVTHMSSWMAFMALAARPMFLSTSALVCEFSRASRWNSTVDSVPSTCVSCRSSLFFLLRACNAAEEGRSRVYEQRAQPLTRVTFAQCQPGTRHCGHLQTEGRPGGDAGTPKGRAVCPPPAPALGPSDIRYSLLPKTWCVAKEERSIFHIL